MVEKARERERERGKEGTKERHCCFRWSACLPACPPGARPFIDDPHLPNRCLHLPTPAQFLLTQHNGWYTVYCVDDFPFPLALSLSLPLPRARFTHAKPTCTTHSRIHTFTHTCTHTHSYSLTNASRSFPLTPPPPSSHFSQLQNPSFFPPFTTS
jgi:hypothetical protein